MSEPLVIPWGPARSRQPAKWAPGPAIESVEELLGLAAESRAASEHRFVWWSTSDRPMHVVYAINMPLLAVTHLIRVRALRRAVPNPAYVAWLRAELGRVS